MSGQGNSGSSWLRWPVRLCGDAGRACGTCSQVPPPRTAVPAPRPPTALAWRGPRQRSVGTAGLIPLASQQSHHAWASDLYSIAEGPNGTQGFSSPGLDQFPGHPEPCDDVPLRGHRSRQCVSLLPASSTTRTLCPFRSHSPGGTASPNPRTSFRQPPGSADVTHLVL